MGTEGRQRGREWLLSIVERHLGTQCLYPSYLLGE